MGVDAKRERWRAVAETAGNSHHVHPCRDKGGGMTVSEGMEHHTRQAPKPHYVAPVAAELVRWPGRAVGQGEYEVVGARPPQAQQEALLELLQAMGAQHFDYR